MSNKIKLDTMNNSSDSPKLATISSTSAKETIYIDVDDEITAIIEKVKTAKGKIIALVLPKRATMLQSIVNMKLLKRSATTAGKNLVLVTTEASLLPLAGLVGLHVADTPTSRPIIPPEPEQISDEVESIDEPIAIADGTAAVDDFDPDKVSDVPIGELASAAGGAAMVGNVEEEIMLDDDSNVPNVTPVKKNNKLKIPSFTKFRVGLILGSLIIILLIIGGIFATKVLPKAAISIQTDSQVIDTKLSLTLDTATKSVDAENKILPATAETLKKTYTQEADTTGEVNNGDRATGTATFSATECTTPGLTPDSVPVGSSITSSGLTFITQEEAVYSFDSFSSPTCAVYTSNEITIRALKGGTAYNLPADSKFTGAGIATGSASGGTDDISKVVSQTDIDNAKAKALKQDTSVVSQDLETALRAKNLLPVAITLSGGSEELTTSAKAGDKADKVTVTVVVPYTMLGVKASDVSTIVRENVKLQIDNDKQKILEDGVSTAKFTKQDDPTATNAVVGVSVESVAGPELNLKSLKELVAGKKAGDIKELLSKMPGVTKVDVTYSPFWVTTAPSNVNKITIDIVKPSGV